VSTPDEQITGAASSSDVLAYDVVVVGAGPVGENVADYAGKGGLSVVVVERELVGGECSYWACIPSKALLRPVHALAAARRVAGAAQAVTGPLDAAAVLDRRDAFVHGFDDSSQVGWLDGVGIALVRGAGRLAGQRRVVVDTAEGPVQLAARRAVVVCTGSAAVLPPVPGLQAARPWTSREATSMPYVPRRLAVIGGGVVSLEMAAAAKGLGAEQVTVLVRGDRVLEQAEPFAGELVVEGLRAAGVDVRFQTSAQRVERTGDGPVRLHLQDGSLEPGGWLPTDEGQAVDGVDGGWLFAAGDVTGRVLLTHQGKYQARLLGDRLAAEARGESPDLARWGRHAPTADDAAVPQVVFTDPEVAAVGLTERQAAERGLRTRLVSYDLGSVAGAALAADGYRGRAALLVDLDREVVLGATFVGPDVAELLHSATIAVVGEVPLSRLWHAVPAFPTVSEVWLRLLEELRAPAR
jgi:dihydrolipoamide dehydrogenase